MQKKNANLSGTERGTLLAETKADGATLVGSPQDGLTI